MLFLTAAMGIYRVLHPFLATYLYAHRRPEDVFRARPTLPVALTQ
jgi:hypothetical protein